VARPTHATRPDDRFAAFLGRAEVVEEMESRLDWPYGELTWQTGPDGTVRIHGAAGRWALDVSPELGTGAGEGEPLCSEVVLPGPDPTLHVPAALAELRGRVVDPSGRPLAYVGVSIHRGDDEDWYAEAASAADGTFLARGLPPGLEYVLQLTTPDHVPIRVAFHVAGDLDVGTLELRPAHTLRVLLVDPRGAPLANKSLMIQERFPSGTLRPEEAEWLVGYGRPVRTTSAEGRARFAHEPAGELELVLRVPQRVSSPEPARGVGIQLVPYQTWRVPVGDEETRLVADLSGYVAPKPPPQVNHTGLVVDGRTGAPLEGAWVLFGTERPIRQERTHSDGTFHATLAGMTYGIQVLAAGYAVHSEPEREWPSGEVDHRFALFPGGGELELEIQDRVGERLPVVDVDLRSSSGTPVLGLVRSGGHDFPFRGQRLSTDGTLSLRALAEQRLRLDFTIGGIVLGQAEVEVGRSGAPEAVRLERSLTELRASIEAAQSADD
jgi:hypothetical protein